MPIARAKCQVCNENESKYSCPRCRIVYCSIACYKGHDERELSTSNPTHRTLGPFATQLRTDATQTSLNMPGEPAIPPSMDIIEEEPIPVPTPLRPLTSLNWPYVPDESAYPDPLKRDDPKSLQLRQYEAIATSPRIREVFAAHPRLKDILRGIDALRGAAREHALHQGLGVAIEDQLGRRSSNSGASDSLLFTDNEDRDALRRLTEAVEAAVRGGDQTLGLDWGD